MKPVLTATFVAAFVFCTGAAAQEVPGCRDAWNALSKAKALPSAKSLVTHDCPVMYRNHWLTDTAGRGKAAAIDECKTAWNDLSSKKVLAHAKTLVSKNCPVMQRNGWKKV